MAGPEGRPQLYLRQFSVQRDGMPHKFPDSWKVPFNQSGTIISFTNKESGPQSPDILSKEWLIDAVAKERRKLIPEGETPWYHLPGTGFWIKEQIGRLMRYRNTRGLKAELGNVGEDFRAFEREYLKQMVSLRWNLAIGEENGKKRIICTDYDNATLESVTNKQERRGIVYDTLFGDKKRGIVGVEEQILNAPVGTMAIIVSPEGWSGMLDADGKPIIYPEAQTYGILKVSEEELQAYTFRTKANILQNEALQRSLGLTTPEITDQKKRITGVFSNVAIITPGEADWAEFHGRKPVREFPDLIDRIQESVGGRAEAYEGRAFDDMRAYLRHPERYDMRHPLTDKLIKRFEEYAKWRFAQGGSEKDIATDLQIALAFNPTQLNKLYRDEGNVVIIENASGMRGALAKKRLEENMRMPGGMDYKKELQQLQELPGCAGGGTSGSVVSIGSSRRAEAGNGSSDNYEFDHDGTCVVCNTGPKKLGPCNICITCDADLGGKGAEIVAEVTSKKVIAEVSEVKSKKDAALTA